MVVISPLSVRGVRHTKSGGKREANLRNTRPRNASKKVFVVVVVDATVEY